MKTLQTLSRKLLRWVRLEFTQRHEVAVAEDGALGHRRFNDTTAVVLGLDPRIQGYMRGLSKLLWTLGSGLSFVRASRGTGGPEGDREKIL